MKKVLFAAGLLLCLPALAQNPPTINYSEDPASVEQAGVPKGEILKFSFSNSKIFPGTVRDYWIYVPAQYSGNEPACFYVNQDGIQWKAPVVFDNLIHKKEMPVTIGVFVTPGRVPAVNAGSSLDRFNRSYEYDGLGDNYVRFLLEELLPEVERQKTSNGRPIRLSKNGNDHAIGGSSSGAICAFTAAWERPDAFSRVFSAIGTYVGLRGGDRYPTLVRKTAPKPIRIFLQDGSSDLNIYAGDWWKANETMERALVFSGYEVNHVWGEDGHSGRQGNSIFPDVMRWLWKDWPQAVKAGNSKNQFLADLLIAGSEWELVSQGHSFTEGTAVDAAGNFYFQDIPNSKTYKLGTDGQQLLINSDAKRGSGSIFGPDGKRYVVAGATKQILRYDAHEKMELVADSLPGNDLVVANNGNVYVTAPDGRENPGKIYLIRRDGSRQVVDEGLRFDNGIALTPDQTQLYVTESTSHWVWVYTVRPDGTLANKQRYGWLHVRDADENSWSDGLKCDTAGRVYVATRMGVQVLDQTGRVNAIIPLPGGADAANLCFAGAAFDTLYVASRDKIFRRKLRTRGANAFDPPVKPVNPRL
ncbi:MAG: SMP-30/gluconolactonase/LRE family protein [Chitinophagaceae bacterium]|nr:SMP-30/gluconolactonase/LRE family protein [Chitinophagaceae bacterium]